MGQTEYKIFIVLATLILMVFINGIVIFIIQYRKRKVLHEKEKEMLHVQHSQELMHTQLHIQEQTMQDIGREIHDGVGQRLTLASIYTNQLSYQNKYPQIEQRVAEISKIINESLAELRGLSKSLTHTSADGSDLAALIKSECDRVNGLHTCKATCSFNSTAFVLSTTVKNFLLRIVQEFMQNSLKHAECRHITVDFHNNEGGLTVTAADDGKGFGSDVYDKAEKGIGLENMKKRAELIGATYSIESNPGKGTRIQVFVPVNKLNA